jgi:hypothetical protein
MQFGGGVILRESLDGWVSCENAGLDTPRNRCSGLCYPRRRASSGFVAVRRQGRERCRIEAPRDWGIDRLIGEWPVVSARFSTSLPQFCRDDDVWPITGIFSAKCRLQSSEEGRPVRAKSDHPGSLNREKNRQTSVLASMTLGAGPTIRSADGIPPGQPWPAPVSFHRDTSAPS